MIKVQDINLSFKAPVLKNVSFEVPHECIYALIGPGAAGKSVLLKTVAGLLTPASGQVWIDGEEVQFHDELALAVMRRKIGYLFQNYALFDKSVGDNIAFPLRRLFDDITEEEITERVAERLMRMSLPGFENRNPSSLSGGQKKRIGVARATVIRAPYVLYDEPTAGLDPVTSQRICNLIRDESREQRTTVLVVSSDIKRVLSIADRVGMMLEGELIFDGTLEEVWASTDPYVHQFIRGETEGPL